MREFLGDLLDLLERGEACALATVFAGQGSTPRAAGAAMLVRADGSIAGTIGGGLLEATVLAQAVEAIRAGRSRVVSYELDGSSVDDTAMLCGGRAEVLIAVVPAGDEKLAAVMRGAQTAARAGERAWHVSLFSAHAGDTVVAHVLVGADGVVAGDASGVGLERDDWLAQVRAGGLFTLPDGRLAHVEVLAPAPLAVICGAGHVAQALVPVAMGVGFRLLVLDDRPDFAAPERFPSGCDVRVVRGFEDALDGLSLDSGSSVVIVTRGHQHDFAVLTQALRSSAGYIGLMASRAKARRIAEALRGLGFTEADIARVHTPIGLAIGAETPAELAISIVAELVETRAARRG